MQGKFNLTKYDIFGWKSFDQNVNSNYKKEKRGVKYALMHFINANAVIKRSNDIGNRPTIVNLCFK